MNCIVLPLKHLAQCWTMLLFVSGVFVTDEYVIFRFSFNTALDKDMELRIAGSVIQNGLKSTEFATIVINPRLLPLEYIGNKYILRMKLRLDHCETRTADLKGLNSAKSLVRMSIILPPKPKFPQVKPGWSSQIESLSDEHRSGLESTLNGVTQYLSRGHSCDGIDNC